MKNVLFSCIVAVLAAGCTISTELDPQGTPKYRQAVRGTGTHVTRRFDAIDAPSTKTLGEEDVERLLRTGGNRKPPGTN